MTHRCPAAHAAPVFPHTHVPDVQALEVAVQAVHAPPVTPHDESVRAVHTLSAQQPVWHVVASHTHRPALQRWKAPHAGVEPHAHEPLESQPLALVRSQAEQSEPKAPQALRLTGFWHAAPLQQPDGQVAELHAPPTHKPPSHVWAAPHEGPEPHRQAPEAVQLSALFAPHATHAVPGAEQVVSERAAQAFATQQPAGQEVASQTQLELTQR